MAMRASLGLPGFLKRLPKTIKMGIRIEPSSTGVALSHVVPLSNSIYIEGVLPDELEIPGKMQPVPDHIKSCIQDRLIQNNYAVGSFNYKGYDDRDKFTRHERTLISQTVQQELTLAIATLIEDKVISSRELCKAMNYSEVRYCAAIEKKGHWFQMVGRADFSLSSPVPLPVTHVPEVGVDDDSDMMFEQFHSGIVSGIEQHEGISVIRDTPPYFASAFRIKNRDGVAVRYPAMNLVIEHKPDVIVSPDIFAGQCALYLVNGSVAYSRFSHNDKPLMVIGAVTDGVRYSFLAFQLNTLDFNSKVKNIIWRKDMSLFEAHNNKFNEATWAQLKRFISYPLTVSSTGI